MKCDIRNHSSMSGIEEVAEKLYNFAQKKLGFAKPARVVFESHGDRAIDIFAPTGNYNPETRTIKIFVDHRHPKDILRSMAHELIHHAQSCQGAFDSPIDTSPGYAQKDDRMRDLERDAYFWGNGILFRDWEDDHKSKRSWNLMNENKKMSLNEQKLRRKIRRLIMETIQEQDVSMADEIAQDFDDDVEETDVDTSGGFDPTGTSTPPADIDLEILRTVLDLQDPLDLEEQAVVELDPESPGGVFKPHLGSEPDSDDAGEEADADAGEDLEEQQQPLEEWYNDTLHETLLRKFKIKK